MRRGVAAGLLFGLLHAVASIRYRADQIVVGIAINLLAVGVTRFVSKPFMIEEFVRLTRELLPVNASEMGSPPVG